jgi:hypothetical protein
MVARVKAAVPGKIDSQFVIMARVRHWAWSGLMPTSTSQSFIAPLSLT